MLSQNCASPTFLVGRSLRIERAESRSYNLSPEHLGYPLRSLWLELGGSFDLAMSSTIWRRCWRGSHKPSLDPESASTNMISRTTLTNFCNQIGLSLKSTHVRDHGLLFRVWKREIISQRLTCRVRSARAPHYRSSLRVAPRPSVTISDWAWNWGKEITFKQKEMQSSSQQTVPVTVFLAKCLDATSSSRHWPIRHRRSARGADESEVPWRERDAAGGEVETYRSKVEAEEEQAMLDEVDNSRK